MIAVDNRPVYFTFVASQTIDERAAKRMNLPSSLVESRQSHFENDVVFCLSFFRGWFLRICVVVVIPVDEITH